MWVTLLNTMNGKGSVTDFAACFENGKWVYIAKNESWWIL